MPKKKIREIAKKYGYQRLRNYRQWDDVHFSAEVNGVLIVINIATRELYERNPFTKKLMKEVDLMEITISFFKKMVNGTPMRYLSYLRNLLMKY